MSVQMSMRPLVFAAAAMALLAAGALFYTSASASGQAATTPAPTNAPRIFVPAPIDALDVAVNGTRATLHVKAGLPGGCAQRDTYKVETQGDAIVVTITNTVPSGNAICTMIYGTYDLTIDLGASFARAHTYTVRVNDKSTTFTP